MEKKYFIPYTYLLLLYSSISNNDGGGGCSNGGTNFKSSFVTDDDDAIAGSIAVVKDSNKMLNMKITLQDQGL
ncbi:hypothetical protein DERF_001402 [Dermatophagoides farinae]|uniref:Uncharacterized protein n=1 Tax=Dermatophagoides farinae TaxID=6954 RepID=A0A922IDM3_DERFA|nr:hypothetical protein DERF_001402 [Dermatophagoides farinae]